MISDLGKFNAPPIRKGWGPRTELTGVNGPLAIDGRDVTYSLTVSNLNKIIEISYTLA